MKRVLIIHGWESNSREHWFQEAKIRLEKMGYQVTVPDMPNTFFPQQEEWVKIIEDFQPDQNSILIGHSLGGPAIWRYLEKAKNVVAQCFFLACPINYLGYEPVKNFFSTDFNWEKIKKMCLKFIVIGQTNDIWVPIGHCQELSKKLEVKPIIVKGTDHFDKIDFSLIENNIMQQKTLCLLIKEKNGQKEILLAMKKRGFGINKWNGTGGKFDPEKGDRNLVDTAIRETQEEISVKIKNLEKRVVLSFYFPHKPKWNQEVYVYWVKEWEGEGQESEETKPQWFKEKNIPYNKMWDDDQYWLPHFLKGIKFKAKFVFNQENKVIEKSFEFNNL